ncbi:hypothetical protein H4W33_004233 [Kibdelosporangium phytohabitans]|nr:hypothetical protein [Kibdelosporangium phytohabitans]
MDTGATVFVLEAVQPTTPQEYASITYAHPAWVGT